MGQSLTDIAQQLRDANRKVQLIYAFNGTGKTRLSREFKQVITPTLEADGNDDTETTEPSTSNVLYYNAFTEDLFYWDNDLINNAQPKLKIQPNAYTSWLLTLLKDLGQDSNIVSYFQRYTSEKFNAYFSEDFSEVSFAYEAGNEEPFDPIKISKGEESNFVWSVFYALLDQVITILNVAEVDERETHEFDHLKYIFIDDPVSSLDQNHLIELAVNLADLIKSSKSDLKFIITTHSTIFYNVLFSELNKKTCYLLNQLEYGKFSLVEKQGDSNRSFSYHLHIKEILEQAVADNRVERFHFTLLRNLYEKSASFLGYKQWSELLPDDKTLYYNRIIQYTSHSTLADDTMTEPTTQEKQTLALLLNHLISNYGFWHEGQQDG